MTVIDGASVQSVPYEAQNIEDEPVAVTAQSTSTTSAPTSDIESLALSAESSASKLATRRAGGLPDTFVEALTSVVVALVDLIATFIKGRDKTEKGTKPTSGGSTKETPSSTKSGSSSNTTPSSGTSKPSPSSGAPTAQPVPSSSSGSKETPTTKSAPAHLTAILDDAGVVTVRTQDGFIIKAEAKQHGWSISDAEGKTTRIFGDPHVKESDGDTWDFKKRGTFFFGKNKLTVETSPVANGATITRQITVYSGKERVTIGGLDKNQPTILALADDGKQHDDALSDGVTYRRGGTSKGENWSQVVNGKRVVMGGKR